VSHRSSCRQDKAFAPDATLGIDFESSQIDTHVSYSNLQRWGFNEDGSISNVACPNLAIATNKERDVSLNSIYFALQNPRSQLAIGVQDCTSGALQMEEMVYGRPSQQFIYNKEAQEIFSLMCPGQMFTIPGGGCNSTDPLFLSNETHNDNRNKWSFNEGTNLIESVKCPNKYVTISAGASSSLSKSPSSAPTSILVASSPSTQANVLNSVTSPTPSMSPFDSVIRTKSSKPSTSPTKDNLENAPESDAEKSAPTQPPITPIDRNTTSNPNAKEWEAIMTPSVGFVLVLSDASTNKYQKWAKLNQVSFTVTFT
jgi:hypothetical protein